MKHGFPVEACGSISAFLTSEQGFALMESLGGFRKELSVFKTWFRQEWSTLSDSDRNEKFKAFRHTLSQLSNKIAKFVHPDKVHF